jgi:hypothetical protein
MTSYHDNATNRTHHNDIRARITTQPFPTVTRVRRELRPRARASRSGCLFIWPRVQRGQRHRTDTAINDVTDQRTACMDSCSQPAHHGNLSTIQLALLRQPRLQHTRDARHEKQGLDLLPLIPGKPVSVGISQNFKASLYAVQAAVLNVTAQQNTEKMRRLSNILELSIMLLNILFAARVQRSDRREL